MRVRSPEVRFGLLALGFSTAILATPPTRAEAAPLPDRGHEPIVLSGEVLGSFQGVPIAEIGVVRYDPEGETFVGIPFQIDQRVDHQFENPDGSGFVERIYDVYDEDDGFLDANDELVFLFGDAGVAPSGALSWPDGAGSDRYEVRVSDPRAGATDPERWVYVVRSQPSRSAAASYISWEVGPSTTVNTPFMAIEYEDRWLLTGYRVLSPCGTGLDLIDRLKGREGQTPTSGESEEAWNLTSEFMGGIVGPVRAVRYVRGAASGYNTVHHDVVYPRRWERTLNVRVHQVAGIFLYFDWLLRPGIVLYTPDSPQGAPQDGSLDGPIYRPPQTWNLMRSPAGGYLLWFEVPPSPLYGTVESYFRDDVRYDDAPSSPWPYGDEDDSALGNHGIRISSPGGSVVDPIVVRSGFWTLCSDEGDADLASAYMTLRNEPLQLEATLQTRGEQPVRTLRLLRDQDDIVLDWHPIPGAINYRVYHAPFPDLPRASWFLAGELTDPPFRDVEAAAAPRRFYSIVPVSSNGEGEW